MGERVRLYTGLYRCPRCRAEYDSLRPRGEDLVCYECGEELQWVNPIQVRIRPYPSSLYIHNTPRERQER